MLKTTQLGNEGGERAPVSFLRRLEGKKKTRRFSYSWKEKKSKNEPTGSDVGLGFVSKDRVAGQNI